MSAPLPNFLQQHLREAPPSALGEAWAQTLAHEAAASGKSLRGIGEGWARMRKRNAYYRKKITDNHDMNTNEADAEEWRQVPTMPHIWASSLGRLRYMGAGRRRMKPGHVLPQQKDSKGYQQANIPIEADGPARSKVTSVHRLVALAFHGLPPVSPHRIVVGHVDDDPSNNRSVNLRWMTQKENLAAPRCRELMRSKNRGASNPRWGKRHSAETRAKMAAAACGRKPSDATRAKRSASLRNWYSEKRSCDLQLPLEPKP